MVLRLCVFEVGVLCFRDFYFNFHEYASVQYMHESCSRVMNYA